MKKLSLFLALLLLTLSLVAPASNSHVLIVADSLTAGDTIASVGGYSDFYLDVYNTNADITNTIYFFDTNFGWSLDMPVYVLDLSAGYNWTVASSVTVAANTKKSYRIMGNGFNILKFINNEYNSAANKVKFTLKAVNKLQFYSG
jgi:hypothetical protein